MFWRVDEVAEFQVRQLFREADRVERVAGRSEDRTELRRPVLERSSAEYWQWSKIDAAEGLVDAVVDVVAQLPSRTRLADDLRDRRSRQTPPGTVPVRQESRSAAETGGPVPELMACATFLNAGTVSS